MVFFSIGLPSRFAEWCDALLMRLIERQLGSVHAVPLNSLEELAHAVISTGSPNLVACSRQPVLRLQNEIIESGHPFLIALGDPRSALRNLIVQTGCSLVDATRAVASSCAAMLSIVNAPNALVLTPQPPPAAAAAIARHFGVAVSPRELDALVAEFAAEFDQEDGEERSWMDALGEREQAVINGALLPYIAQSDGRTVERLVWEPELFYTTADPAGAELVPATGPIDITGRVRFLIYGPFINLPPGPWSIDVVIGFSAEAAGMSFIVEAFADTQLGQTRIEAVREEIVETRLHVTIGGSIDQAVQLRVYNERAAFDGRLALGYVALTRQAAIPEETRQQLVDVLHR